MGHHGSHTSTSEEFLSHVEPACHYICRKDNNFGHPSPQVINALNNNEVKVLRTDIHGAVTFKIHGKDVKIYTTKSRRRYINNEKPDFVIWNRKALNKREY